MSELSNDYIQKIKIREDSNALRYKMMYDDMIKNEKAITNTLDAKEMYDNFKINGLENDVYVILVYGNLETIAKNLDKRRKEGDFRTKNAFNHFSKKYGWNSDVFILTRARDNKAKRKKESSQPA